MRLVCMSDTHGFHKKLTIPDGDMFICAGDFSMRAKMSHVVEFARWVDSLPHKYKIVVPGNHDMACEGNELWAQEEFAPAVFFRHDYHYVGGLRIFGSAYSSSIFEPSEWCYDYPRYGEFGPRLWSAIRDYPVDVLITHGPPRTIGDRVISQHDREDPHDGDGALLRVVKDIQPKVHIFGHIHEGYGSYTIQDCSTRFYNVSVCTVEYQPTNPVTIVDLD